MAALQELKTLRSVLEGFEDLVINFFLLKTENFSASICISSSITKMFMVVFFIFWVQLIGSNIVVLLVQKKWSLFTSKIAQVCKDIIKDSLGSKGKDFFPLLLFLFFFILASNLLGLIPYTYSLTSQLLVTLILSYTVFGGIIIISIKTQNIGILNHFMPAGTSIYLSPLLVPVEMLSFFFRPLSLGIRLFANIMAGHTLLKVIIGFCWSLLGVSIFFFFIPLSVVIILYILEVSVAIIQTYVFGILTVVYLSDSIN